MVNYVSNLNITPLNPEDGQFTGKKYDPGTGLVYFGGRFYDPEIGRFINQDPAKQGLNWYEYCNSNPLRNIDTNGCGFWDTVNNIAYAIVPGGYAWNKGITAIFNGNYNNAAQWLALSFTQAGVCIYSAGLSSTLNQSSDAISASAETTASADSLGTTSSSTASATSSVESTQAVENTGVDAGTTVYRVCGDESRAFWTILD